MNSCAWFGMNKLPTLPPKELSLFKKVVKNYDQKQYKIGLKHAKQILGNPKFSEHGETLAMKAILLNCLGKNEEAREYVKRGLKANITSFVCWHIYGLIQKSDRKYEEAIKCYMQALKFDSQNIQVLRDLSVLQMQLRNYEGCKDTRYKLLLLRPSQRVSWLGYASNHHLLNNYETALTVLKEFNKWQNDATANYENSELILYEIMIMLESNQYELAFKYLEDHSDDIVDVTALLELKVDLLLKMKKSDLAEACAWDLIERNQESRLYIDTLCRIRGDYPKVPDHLAARKIAIEEIINRYPSSRLAKRLVLDVLSGEEFKSNLDSYLRYHLRKGAPPLFVQLSHLWSDPDKVVILEDLLSNYRYNLDHYGVLNSSPNDLDKEKEPPSTDVWLNYFAAQFLSSKAKYKESLDLIDTQLSKTPTLVDFYTLKADVFNDAGDVITASRWMEEAQSLDTADRYMNARCTKYMVQAHRLDDSVNMASKFTRGKSSASDYLSEMQCMWFLIENARAQADQGKFGDALKLCHEIDRHYQDILDDQLDFHSYCLRKGTLRAYVGTLRLEDRLWDHPSYFDVARLAFEIYTHLHVKPFTATDDMDGGDKNDISTSEAKKLRNKQRKAARRAEAEAARVRAEQDRREQAVRSRQPASEDPDSVRNVSSDQRLDPNTLARPNDPLEMACKFIRPLLDLSPKRIEVHCMAYELYEKKQKLLLLLKSIARGLRLPKSCDHPWFHECCVRFLLLMQSHFKEVTNTTDSPINRVLLSELPKLFDLWQDANTFSPRAFNDAFLERNKCSFLNVFRGALMRCLIEPANREEILNHLPLPTESQYNVSWQTCSDALMLLRRGYVTPLGQVDAVIVDRFRLACQDQFPMANAFMTDPELDELRSRMVEEAVSSAVCGVYNTFDGTGYETSSGIIANIGDRVTDLSISGDISLNGELDNVSSPDNTLLHLCKNLPVTKMDIKMTNLRDNSTANIATAN